MKKRFLLLFLFIAFWTICIYALSIYVTDAANGSDWLNISKTDILSSTSTFTSPGHYELSYSLRISGAVSLSGPVNPWQEEIRAKANLYRNQETEPVDPAKIDIIKSKNFLQKEIRIKRPNFGLKDFESEQFRFQPKFTEAKEISEFSEKFVIKKIDFINADTSGYKTDFRDTLSWRVDVMKIETDQEWPDTLKLWVKRISAGIPDTLVSGGISYIEVGDTYTEFFTGSNNVNDIDIQFKAENFSMQIPAEDYSFQAIFKVVQTGRK